jgi:hypothetical protein
VRRWPDFAADGATLLRFDLGEIELSLQVEPELRRSASKLASSASLEFLTAFGNQLVELAGA